MVSSLLTGMGGVPDVVLDRLLNPFVRLEPYILTSDQGRPDSPRLGAGRSPAARAAKSQRIAILKQVLSTPGQALLGGF